MQIPNKNYTTTYPAGVIGRVTPEVKKSHLQLGDRVSVKHGGSIFLKKALFRSGQGGIAWRIILSLVSR